MTKNGDADEALDWSALFGEHDGSDAYAARLARMEERARKAEAHAREAVEASCQSRAWAAEAGKSARGAQLVSGLCAAAVALLALAEVVGWLA